MRYERGFDEEIDTRDELEAGLPGLDAEADAIVELLAASAERAATDEEACGLMSGLTVYILAPTPVHVRRLAPLMIRRTVALVRVLRRSPVRRHLIRTVPIIVKRTAGTLVRKASKGRPVTGRTLARVLHKQTRTLLGTPARRSAALRATRLHQRRLKRMAASRRRTRRVELPGIGTLSY